MKRFSVPGLVAAALYIAIAIVVVMRDRAAPISFTSGFASFMIVLPARILGISFHVSDNAAMACAILFCAVLFYFLGWRIAKVIRLLRNVLARIFHSRPQLD